MGAWTFCPFDDATITWKKDEANVLRKRMKLSWKIFPGQRYDGHNVL